jgi:hypothetical protein
MMPCLRFFPKYINPCRAYSLPLAKSLEQLSVALTALPRFIAFFAHTENGQKAAISGQPERETAMVFFLQRPICLLSPKTKLKHEILWLNKMDL